MWEVFSFVNPIGNHCLKTEKAIIDFTNKHGIKAHFRFIALNSFQAVDNYIKNNNFNTHDINLRNAITDKVYKTTLLYKAATFQGNNKGRNFLMGIQNTLNNTKKQYTLETVKEIAIQSGLDWDLLQKDCKSKLVLNKCFNDQQKASELGVDSTPSTVIYDYSQDSNEGVLISRCSIEDLDSILHSIIEPNTQVVKTIVPDLHIVE